MTESFKKRYISSRKAYIAENFKGLNERQLEAVLATEGPVLILAGAGSGKTTVLINRIANLLRFGRASDTSELPNDADENKLLMLENFEKKAEAYAVCDRVMPWQILAITFTNKAADEMKRRLEEKLGSIAMDIWACTFHSACVKILRRDAPLIGFGSNFSIYDTSDSVSLIKHILNDMNLDEKYFPPKAILAEISRAKDSMLMPEEYSRTYALSSDLHKQKIASVYSEYVRRMKLSDSMDFDDLILNSVIILNNYENARHYWQNRFKYVMIDEYQDTNKLQYVFASLISGRHKNICVVGDDNQSIYKFRGATIENILNFETEFNPCRTIRLEQNYRSTEHILDAANSVISNNINRTKKTLWTDNSAGDPIEMYCADDEHDEAQYVAGKILSGFSKGENWRDFAVLYRMNAQSNNIEYAFKRNGIPYRIIGGTRFFDRSEVKDILSYMSVVSSSEDDLRLERIINMPPRGIGKKSVETALSISAKSNKSLFYVISHADLYDELSRPSVKMLEFAKMISELRDFSENNTPDVLFDEIIEKTGYLKMLEEKSIPENTSKSENVKEIKTSILGYMKDSGDNSLNGYLANVALYTDLDNYDSNSDAAVLMTMHSSKGLEFPNVFIVGMEETIFPGIKAIGETEEMEEERRLCYVAITRAKKNLYFVCARQRMLFGRTNSNRTSRFIDEISEKDIVKNIPKGFGYSDNHESFYNNESTQRIKWSVPSKNIFSKPELQRQDEIKILDLSIGDKINHKAFGKGIVINSTPMGGDALLVIDFEECGSKKLMLRVAARYITKEMS